jgi:cell division septal protein FtsQ
VASPDSRVKVISVSGNYLFSKDQICQMAGVSMDTRLWLVPDFLISSKVQSNPLIESCTVKKSGMNLSIQVQEQTVIGYYVQDDANYMLTTAGESIEVQPEYLNLILYFPLLSGLDEEQMQQLCQVFSDNSKYLDREIIAQIAEIVPYQSSYDENMLKLTMQDGNVIFTSMEDFIMMTHYEDLLPSLLGQSVCLLLDKDNSAVNKVDCSYLNMSLEERAAYRQQLQEAQKAETQPAQTETTDKDDEDKDEEENAEETEEESSSQLEADDWEESGIWNYEYSPSLGLYRDPSSGTLYEWSEDSLSFSVVE